MCSNIGDIHAGDADKGHDPYGTYHKDRQDQELFKPQWWIDAVERWQFSFRDNEAEKVEESVYDEHHVEHGQCDHDRFVIVAPVELYRAHLDFILVVVESRLYA